MYYIGAINKILLSPLFLGKRSYFPTRQTVESFHQGLAPVLALVQVSRLVPISTRL